MKNKNDKDNKPSLVDQLSETIYDVTVAGGGVSSSAASATAAPTPAATARSLSGSEYRPSPDDKPESIPSDRSWENCLPRIIRDRACAIRAEDAANNTAVNSSSSSSSSINGSSSSSTNGGSSSQQRAIAQTAYEKRCVASDRDICNFLGCVMAVDFRHWIASTYGDDVSRVECCWCRERTSPVLPCKCMKEGCKTVFEPSVKQMYAYDAQAQRIVRGSAAMVARMRDHVDEAAESNPNKFWFRPQVMIRRLLTKDNNSDGVSDGSKADDGRFEMIDDFFTGVADDSGKNVPLLFPATAARLKILTEVAEFFQRTGKDFYDLVVESGRRLIGTPGAASQKETVPELNSTGLPFQALPGLLPALCRHIPRFLDCAPFSRPEVAMPSSSSSPSSSRCSPSSSSSPASSPAKKGASAAEGESSLQEQQQQQAAVSSSPARRQPKFTVAPRIDPTKEKSFLKTNGSPFRTRSEAAAAAEASSSSQSDQITVLFLKLAQLFCTSLRSCRGLFASKDLKWLRDNEPFIDEAQHLTICSDYQIPNALRFAGILCYSPELTEDITARRLLPSQSLKEAEIRLSSVLAGTAIREQFLKRCDDIVTSIKQSKGSKSKGSQEQRFADFRAAFFLRAKERFTTAVLDYVLWMFGRRLTSAKLGQPHHLCPGIMY